MSEEKLKILGIALNCNPRELVQKYKELKKLESEFNDLYVPIKSKLVTILEEYMKEDITHKHILIDGVNFSYVSPSVRSTVDTKKLKEEEPKLVKKYMKDTKVEPTIKISILF